MQATTKEFQEAYGSELSSEELTQAISSALSQVIAKVTEGERRRRFMSLLNEVFREEEQHNKIVTEITINPKVFAIIRCLGKDFFDESTVREIRNVGIFGHIWTASIRCDANVDGVKVTGTEGPFEKKE